MRKIGHSLSIFSNVCFRIGYFTDAYITRMLDKGLYLGLVIKKKCNTTMLNYFELNKHN